MQHSKYSKALLDQLEKLRGHPFCWDNIKEILLMYGTKVRVNTRYGIHLIQAFIDNKEIIFDLEDDIIYNIYL